jgi:hypothetical protein
MRMAVVSLVVVGSMIWFGSIASFAVLSQRKQHARVWVDQAHSVRPGPSLTYVPRGGILELDPPPSRIPGLLESLNPAWEI